MRRIDGLGQVPHAFQFKTLSDRFGDTYILFADNPLDTIPDVSDRTAFEAVENHLHVLDRITAREWRALIGPANQLCQTLLSSLKAYAPHKYFYVSASIRLHDSMILRFHQKWEQEPLYVDPADTPSPLERIYVYDG